MDHLPPLTRRPLMALLLVALILLAGMTGVAAQGSTTSVAGGPTVPAAPPWRAELIPRNRPLTVTVGDVPVQVEVANTEAERQLGLGRRAGLLPGTGMLFVFDTEPEVQNFWMGGMRFCLDIVWLNDGAITGAAESTCPGPPDAMQDLIPRHQSPGVAEYVLEVPAGFLAEHGLGVGSPVAFSTDPYGLPTPDPLRG